MSTQLDQNQIIQKVYDPDNNQLRTSSQITGPLDINGDVMVDIKATDGDSVIVYGTQDGTISGTLQVLKVNADGSIDVNSGGGGSTDVNLHDGSGTAITSQANGSQQALDVGINVSGVQVDPRSIRPL